MSKAEPFLIEIWDELENDIFETRKGYCCPNEHIERLSHEEVVAEMKGTLAMLGTCTSGHVSRCPVTGVEESTIVLLKQQLCEDRARCSVI